MVPFLWKGVQLSQGCTQPLQGGSLLFTTNSPGNSGTYLINLGRMYAESTLESPSVFEHKTYDLHPIDWAIFLIDLEAISLLD